jgi:glycosyltransferase involved in cell wall biosynthesis
MRRASARSRRNGAPAGESGTRFFFDARYIRTDHHDGISRFSAELAAATHRLAAASNVDVTYLICDEQQRARLPEGAQTLQIHAPTSPKEPFTALVLNRHHPDVVFSPMQTIGSLGRRFALILTLHDTIYYRHRTPPKNLPALVRLGWRLFHLSYVPQRIVLNQADLVATVSETSKRQFAAARLTRRPVVVLSNAPQDLAQLLPTGSARCADGPPQHIVYMGSFMPYKNVETIVRAMAHLPNHTLHLLSRISESHRRELEQLAAGSQVVFHGGVTDAEYAALLADRAILATLSLDEGYGLPIAEALAFGVPAVVSDLEIFHEVAGEGALYVPAKDAQAFAAAVRSLDDQDTREHVIAAGLDQAARFSWSNTARALLSHVNQLASRRRPLES